MRLLLAINEAALARSVSGYLRHCRFTVELAEDAEAVRQSFAAEPPELLVLDECLGTEDTCPLVQELRGRHFELPILMLTRRNDFQHRIAAYDAGADNVLPEPFLMAELYSRIRAVLRRGGAYRQNSFGLGNTALDPEAYCLTGPLGQVSLGRNEYRLLERLLREPFRLLGAEELREQFSGGAEAKPNFGWTTVAAIRRKLTEVGSDLSLRTLRGVGYRLELAGRAVRQEDL